MPLSRPVARISGECSLSGDKSVSHRLALFSIINRGAILIENLSNCRDVQTSLIAAESLGVSITRLNGKIELKQTLPRDHYHGNIRIDCGNSGTTARLLAGILCTLNGDFVLTGDDSLSLRPMQRIIEPLSLMKARISSQYKEFLPIRISGSHSLEAMDFFNKKASAQVKSAILFAAMIASGTTKVSEPFRSRDHTERLFKLAGLPLTTDKTGIAIIGPVTPDFSETITVPGDPSSAAFLAIAAAIIPGSKIKIKNMLLNHTRTEYLRVLEQMGSHIKVIDNGDDKWEPSGDVEISYGKLKAIKIRKHQIPLLLDEIPALAVAMAFAEGESMFEGAGELRVKESDRISNIASQFKIAGIDCQENPDGLTIRGSAEIAGNVCMDSYGDHRLAMAFFLLGLRSQNGVSVKNTQCIDISFPDFPELIYQLSVFT